MLVTIQSYISEKGLFLTECSKDGVVFAHSIHTPTPEDLKPDIGRTFTGSKGVYTLSDDRKYGLQFVLKTASNTAGL